MSLLADAALALGRSGSNRDMNRVVDAARRTIPTPEDAARLALVLARSGAVRPAARDCADVASTGGPGSLTTLLSPLTLQDLGFRVPKIGVPGRPAGGIDTLGTLPGYRTVLSAEDFDAVLTSCGYAHALAGAELAPLDGVLFAHRQAVGAQRVPLLVVASLLAKKVAAGLSTVVLDVRVGPGGNLGVTAEQARLASRLFVRTAAELGIRAVCVLSDGAALRQPFLGRGEALVATAASVGLMSIPEWLPAGPRDAFVRHGLECSRLAWLAAPWAARIDSTLASRLSCHLDAQGSSQIAFDTRVAQTLEGPFTVLTADSAGTLTADLSVLRDLVVTANQAPASGKSAFADRAGATFLAMPGDRVLSGQPIVRLRGLNRLPPLAVGVCPEAYAGPAPWDGEIVAD